jgi:hypothetical protein
MLARNSYDGLAMRAVGSRQTSMTRDRTVIELHIEQGLNEKPLLGKRYFVNLARRRENRVPIPCKIGCRLAESTFSREAAR